MGDKKKKEKGRLGKFLKDKGPGLLQGILGIAGNFIPGAAIASNVVGAIFGDEKEMISEMINTSDLSIADKLEANRLLELDYADLKDARAMQVAIVTSSESTTLAKNFVYYLAIGIFIFSAAVTLMLFFIEIPDKNRDVINFILGVLVGTGLTGIFNYFLGSSKGSSDKMNHIINNNK